MATGACNGIQLYCSIHNRYIEVHSSRVYPFELYSHVNVHFVCVACLPGTSQSLKLKINLNFRSNIETSITLYHWRGRPARPDAY